MKRVILSLMSAATLVAQTAGQPKGDGCAPPPGSTAPSLPARLLTGQGSVHFAITTSSAEAQKFFNQGVAQMHSFWAREAERSFLQAAALDPEAPMPHWGVAMVAGGDWRPRFQLDNIEEIFGRQKQPAKSRALDAARKAVELSQAAGKATELEKLYIASVMARRNPEATDANEDFVRALRGLLAKYPDEVEASSYLSLMIMRGFTLPDKKPKQPGSTEAVEILRRLLAKAPDHPGVHHYVIHGWEGSSFAKDAWPSSTRYAELVTNIPHALHMPGHIWSQTGKWNEAIKSFADAAVNERAYMKADSLYGNGHHGHNVHYLATAYSFSGDYDQAIQAARELLAMKENPREARQPDNRQTAYSQGWFAMLRTLVQFEKWNELIRGDLLPANNRPRESAWCYWALALAHSAAQDRGKAAEYAARMDASLDDFRRKTKRPVPPELAVARRELDGHLAVAAGKARKGMKLLQSASREERRLRYNEPPYYPRPVNEALGRIALRHGNPGLAEKAFRGALEQFPADAHAETGLRQALEASRRTVSGGGVD